MKREKIDWIVEGLKDGFITGGIDQVLSLIKGQEGVGQTDWRICYNWSVHPVDEQSFRLDGGDTYSRLEATMRVAGWTVGDPLPTAPWYDGFHHYHRYDWVPQGVSRSLRLFERVSFGQFGQLQLEGLVVVVTESVISRAAYEESGISFPQVFVSLEGEKCLSSGTT